MPRASARSCSSRRSRAVAARPCRGRRCSFATTMRSRPTPHRADAASPRRGWPQSCSRARTRPHPPSDRASSTTEADRIAQLIGARVTLIARGRQGARRFVRDARRRGGRWRTTRDRPEVVEARARRHRRARAATAPRSKIDMLYVAAPVRHPTIAFVRRGAAADRRPPAAARRPDGDADGARASRWLGAALLAWTFCGAHRRGASQRSRASRARYRRGDFDAARARLRRRRARHGRARARRLGAGARAPAGGAGARSRAHGGDPRRHGRGRDRRRSRRAAAAGERRGAADAAARRDAPSGVLHRDDPASRRSPSCSATRSRAATPDGVELSPPRDPSRIVMARAAPARGGSATAPCSCCTTSPSCAAPIRSGAISSPTSRTSCARR